MENSCPTFHKRKKGNCGNVEVETHPMLVTHVCLTADFGLKKQLMSMAV